MKGRGEAAAVAERLVAPVAVSGQAPPAHEVLQWLLRVAEQEQNCFDTPARLLDRAVSDQLIDAAGREPLARRILALIDEGYLRGSVLDIDQATAEQALAGTENLQLTVKATTSSQFAGRSTHTTINTQIINSQIASGDITNYVTFADVLDRAYAEVDALDDLDEDTKGRAKGLIDQMRAKTGAASSQILTGTAATVVASVIARLLGIS